MAKYKFNSDLDTNDPDQFVEDGQKALAKLQRELSNATVDRDKLTFYIEVVCKNGEQPRDILQDIKASVAGKAKVNMVRDTIDTSEIIP